MPRALDSIPERGIESALFTTYAISLTFFETVVLRRLRQAGCGEIWVVVDRDGYEKSLMERRSSRVGQEYRLIPAVMPNGILHAKCTYLQGTAADRLLIGSGNLTFGGYGRNLEVLEVFEPESAGSIFAEFSDFLRALNQRSDFACGDRGWIKKFANRSNEQAASGTKVSGTTLVHNVTASVAQQLIAQSGGSARRVTVLSPFHDVDGRAVRIIAEGMRAKEVRIGLPARPGDLSTFPFSKAKAWPLDVSAVSPDVPKKKRPLHAKWFEIELPDRVVTLTGSANATSKALSTTDNIEVGVLRIGDHSFATWKTAKTPTQTPAPEPIEGTSQKPLVVHATLLGNGLVTGMVIGAEASGSWCGEISLPDGSTAPAVVEVGHNGEFETRFPDASKFLFSSSLQIELERGGRVARGWVHYDELLRMPRLRGLGVSALLRLMSREETDEDAVALLDYLASSAHQHTGAFASRVIREDEETEKTTTDPGDAYVPTLMLKPNESQDLATPFSNNGTSHVAALEQFFTRLRTALLQPNPGVGFGSRSDKSLDDDDEDSKHPEQNSQRRIEKAIRIFDQKMSEFIKESTEPRASSALLVMWLEVQGNMLVIRMNQPDEAVRFAHVWLARASELCTACDDIGPLEQHVVTIASLLAAVATPHRRAEQQRISHERLETYYGREVMREKADKCAEIGSQVAFVRELMNEGQDLQAELTQLLEAPTIRGELKTLLRLADEGGELPVTSESFSSSDGQEFLQALRSATWKRRVREALVGKEVCAHCYIVFSKTSEMSLRSRRFARCASCGKFSVRTKP